jgi:hypothetical protein
MAVATIVSNRVRFVGIGSSVITARQAGDATYAPVKYQRPLTVVKGDQTIIFGELPEKGVDDPDFALTATVNSGLPISYSSSDESVATVTGNMVAIHSAGSTVITASQGGSALWNAAVPVEQTAVG